MALIDAPPHPGILLPAKPAIIRMADDLKHYEASLGVLLCAARRRAVPSGGATAYRYFRINVTANNGASNLLISELKIFVDATDNPTSALTSDTAPSPYVASASTVGSGGQAAWKGFNDATGTADDSWSASTSTGWLKIDMGSGGELIPTSYKVTGSTSVANQSPKDWTFEGSNNDSDWDVLDTVTGETAWSVAEERTYTL